MELSRETTMITITIPLNEYFHLSLRGMKEYIVVDDGDKERITAQDGWEGVCHFEPEGGSEACRQDSTEGSEACREVSIETLTVEAQEESKALPGRTHPGDPPAPLTSPRLWQLWPAKSWQESVERRTQSKLASDRRVASHNAQKSLLDLARQRLLKVYPESKVDYYLSNINDYPKLKEKLGL